MNGEESKVGTEINMYERAGTVGFWVFLGGCGGVTRKATGCWVRAICLINLWSKCSRRGERWCPELLELFSPQAVYRETPGYARWQVL